MHRLNASREYFHHKFAFRSVLEHAGVAQPETIALIAHERILLNPLRPDRRYVTAHEWRICCWAMGKLHRQAGGRLSRCGHLPASRR